VGLTWTKRAPILRGVRSCGPFGRLSGSQPAWIWAWSRESPRFVRRHPPHRLSPARANHPAGQDPEARSAALRHHSNAPIGHRKPVISEQESCSYATHRAARLKSAKLRDCGHPTGDNIIQPPTTSRDGADQAGPALELLRTDVASRCIAREKNLAGLLEGGLCQGIVSNWSSERSDASSALSDLSLMISLSLCTTIPATSSARSPRSPKRRLAVADLPRLVARCSFNDFTMTSSMPAAGTRETDPTDAVLANTLRLPGTFLEDLRGQERRLSLIRNYCGFNPSASNC
jgi:hypothetical protein